MSSHKNLEIDQNITYEPNVVGVKGILFFGLGLFLLIVLTFGIMWAFLYVLEDRAMEEGEKNKNPVALEAKDMLPPKERLQSAPGFGVMKESGGFVNLELREPQAEYKIVKAEWDRQIKKGERNGDVIISLPIEEAKEKVINEKLIKVASETDGKETLKEFRRLVTGANSGR